MAYLTDAEKQKRIDAVYRKGHRADAELMLALREARQLCSEQGVAYCILGSHHTALEGWDDPDMSLVELGLAMRIPKLPRSLAQKRPWSRFARRVIE